MNVGTRPGKPGPETSSEIPEATLKAAGGWVAQFARTLKTCRLYDAGNPTVARFRAEFAAATIRLVEDHEALTFQFRSDDVLLEGHSLYPARSRDDNFAHPFHRDGVRAITLRAGLEEQEVHALVDAVLAVSGQNLDDDDLVTLLWESNFRHLDIDYIPSEGDVGGGDAQPAGESGEGALLPWPTPEEPGENGGQDGGEAATAEANAPGTAQAGAAPKGRSEDWLLGDLTVEVEAAFVELDSLAPVESERFRREFAEEHMVSPVAASLAIALACLAANASDTDRAEMSRFLPRILRGAISVGHWAEAREALAALRQLAPPTWSEETFVQELLQPVSITRMIEKLDQQEEPGVADFLALAGDIGDPGIDWTTLALSESNQRAIRQVLAEALAQRCQGNPERLAPWLSDERWYVVRNIVYILGWIGGPGIVGLLKSAVRHPDPRVREQVIAALGKVELRHARGLLIRALDGADTRQFCQVLHLLSQGRDPATARFVFAFLQQEKFELRPPEERRAIYAALASVGGDEIVHELEGELLKGNWFDRSQEIHRHNVARCLGRIGTARAREVLQRAAQSKREPVRQAAQAALVAMEDA